MELTPWDENYVANGVAVWPRHNETQLICDVCRTARIGGHLCVAEWLSRETDQTSIHLCIKYKLKLFIQR